MLHPVDPNTVAVVGGGIAGLSLGWELAKRGRHVTVLEAERIGGGASATATSYMEPRFGKGASRRLEWESLRRWPAFARELEEVSGVNVGLTFGQWRFAYPEDEARVRNDMEKRRGLGWSVEWMDGDAMRERVPELSSDIVGATCVADAGWVDGPAVCRALVKALHGQDVREGQQTRVIWPIGSSDIVVACGTGANTIDVQTDDGEPVSPLPNIRPLKGTTLFYPRLIQLPAMLRHPNISIVPRPDGVVVGASKEEGATSLEPDPTIVARLHSLASRALPVLANTTPQPSCAWRAYVPDRALALGRSTDMPNLWWSLGHGGVGYLRAPLVAHELAAALCGEADALDFCAPFFDGSPRDALESEGRTS